MPLLFSHLCFRRSLCVGLLVALGVASATAPAQAQTSVGTKVKPLFGKVASPISALYNGLSAAKAQRRTFSASVASQGTGLLTTSTTVAAEIAVTGSVSTVRAQLVTLGVKITGEYGPHFDVILPIALIDDVGKLPGVACVVPNYGAASGVGAVTSQGDRATRADIARSNGSVDGTGQKVGVISDSFNQTSDGSYAADQTSGDLPAGVDVVEDFSTGVIDEGRAMLQIVHDVAPNAGLAFATGFTGQAGMAANIGKLRTQAGCTVITDDIYYFAAPFFTDGLVAQAINQCVNAGVPYFVLANNQGKDSYEATYSPTSVTAIGNSTGTYTVHNFNPGGVDGYQQITIPTGRSIRIILEWDDVWKSLAPTSNGATSDFDFFLVNSTNTSILKYSNADNIGGDPVESLSYTNTTGAPLVANLVILHYKGTATPRLKYISFNGGASINEYATNSGTIYGNSNASRGLTIGAADYRQTPRYGQTPALVESFSSRGGNAILRNPDGTSITPVTRQKPDIVAIDGVDTTFFGSSDPDSTGYTNFFGTSAAAPHAAAVAALLLQKKPSLTPDQIYAAMRSTALDMSTPGFDYDSGSGLINAEIALNAVQAQSGPDFVVTSNADNGDGVCNASGVGDGCTLREAVNAANANSDTSQITFDVTAFGSSKKTIALTQGNLAPIITNVSITGPSTAGAGVTISSTTSTGAVMEVSGGPLALANLAFTAGATELLITSGSATVSGCTFSGASSTGVNNLGTLTLNNSTVIAPSQSGVINNGGTATVDSCTITGCNVGINSASTQTNLLNSLVVGNSTNVVGSLKTDDHNITGSTLAAAGLQVDSNGDAVLASNGGPTQTVALVGTTGTAIDTGQTNLTTDQRGLTRPSGSADDIGAFELQQQADLSTTLTDGVASVKRGSGVTYTLTVSNAGPFAVTGATVTDTFPAELSGISFTGVGAGGATGPSSGTGNINATVNLPVASSFTFTISATVSTSAGSTLSNTASIAAPTGITDPTPGNNSAKDDDTVINSAPVISQVTITPSAPGTNDTLTAHPTASDVDGDTLTYTYMWKNGLSVVQNSSSATLDLSQPGYGDNGDSITVTVTANDGTVDSAPVASLPVPIGNSAPSVDAVSPVGASNTVGETRQFSVTVSDPNGVSDIVSAWLLINTKLDWDQGATLVYLPNPGSPATGQLYLRRGDSFLSPIQVGSSQVLDNGALRVAGSDVSVSLGKDGNTLTLSLLATIREGLVGQNTLFGRVEDTQGAVDVDALAGQFGFINSGSYTVTTQFSGPNVAPTLSGLSPVTTNTQLNSSGVAPGVQTFGFFFKDDNGSGDLESVCFMAGPKRDWSQSATFVYIPRTRRLYLRSDDGSSFLGGGQIGSPGILENSQVRVDLAKVIVRIYSDGKSQGLSLPLQAKSGLVGNNKVWLRVQDNAGLTAPNGDDLGFVQSGAWNVKAAPSSGTPSSSPSTGQS